MKNVAYYNGKMGLQEELTIPFLDRAMFFGDGVYDATYSANRKIFEKDWHLERFYNSLKAVKIPFKLSKEELLAELQKCIDAMDSDGVCFVYWEVTRGTAPRNHLFPDVEPNLIINITESKLTDLRTPCKLITEEDTRFFHCNIKTLNLIPSVIAAQRAREAGCGEAILYRPGGRVTEGAHSNIHILKAGELWTAPADNLILPGIGRAHLLRACRALDIPVHEEAFTLADLFTADEVLMTISSHPCCRANLIDGKPVGMRDEQTFEKLRTCLVREFLADGQ
jgi:D-alanine transaminase